MKKLIFLLYVLSISASAFSQDMPQISPKTKLLVYYFHLTNRCKTCTNIEATTRKVLNENFKAEMDSSIMVFQTFNVELPENKTICEKYEAYGATLALTSFAGGAMKIEDMTNFAFSKIHTEDLFIEGLKIKILELLK